MCAKRQQSKSPGRHPDPSAQNVPGGQGEAPHGDTQETPPDDSVLSKAEMKRWEMQLIRQALGQHYQIPPSALKAVPAVLLNIIAKKDASDRTKISAINTFNTLNRHLLDQYRTLRDLDMLGAGDEVRFVGFPFAPPESLLPGKAVAQDDEEPTEDEADGAAG